MHAAEPPHWERAGQGADAPAWQQDTHAPQDAWDYAPAWREPEGNAAWRDGDAFWDGGAPAPPYEWHGDEHGGYDEHAFAYHEPPPPPPPPPQHSIISLAPIPAGWSRHAAAPSAANPGPAAVAPDVDALSKLLSAAAGLLERRPNAASAAQPQRGEDAPHAVPSAWRNVLPSFPAAAADGGVAATAPVPIPHAHRMPTDTYAAETFTPFDDGGGGVQWQQQPPPPQAARELSDDSSDASSDGGGLEPMRDAAQSRGDAGAWSICGWILCCTCADCFTLRRFSAGAAGERAAR